MNNIINLDIIEHYSSITYLFISIFIIILAILLFRKRSRSGFSIRHKILVFILGKEKSQISKNDLINEIFEIEKFNFHYNTNAYSLRHKENFENWIREYEIDYRLIQKLGNKFDITELKISQKPISKRLLFPIIIIYSLFTTSILAFLPNIIELVHKDSALLKFTESKKWVWVNPKVSEELVFWINTPSKITIEMCQENNKQIDINLTHSEIQAICDIMIDKKNKNFLSKTIKEQRFLFIILFTLLLIIFYFVSCKIYKTFIIVDANKMIINKEKIYNQIKKETKIIEKNNAYLNKKLFGK